MALATQEDVEAILGRGLTEPEAALVNSQLDEASDLVVGELYPCPIPDPVPDAIKRVTAAMVVALITRPAGVPANADTLTAGPYSQRFTEGSTASGPWLTATLKRRLRPFKCGNGAGSISIASERYSL